VKDLFQTFFYTLTVGFVVFCLVALLNKKKFTFNWEHPNDNEWQQKTDDASEKVDDIVDKSKQLYDAYEEIEKKNRMQDEIEDDVSKEVEATFEDEAYNYTEDKTTTKTVAADTKQQWSPKKEMYVVQLGLFAQNQVELGNYNTITDLGKLYTETNRTNKKILLGNYASRYEAQQVLDEVKARGFEDAFLTVRRTAVRTNDTAVKTNQNDGAVVTENNTMAAKQTDLGNTRMIQLMAMRDFSIDAFEIATTYGAVYTNYDANRGITRVLLGHFKNETELQLTLEKLQRIGFNEAYARTLSPEIAANLKKMLPQS
jgi:hypothetical protein